MASPGESPLNREPRLRDLVSRFITRSGAYHRNHSIFPAIDGSLHLVQVGGEVKRPLTLTLTQLRDEFAQHEVTCALQCAGNRRHTMRTKLKEVRGVDWRDGAVMNCTWRGPRLRDVLLRAGVKSEYAAQSPLHVEFLCFQAMCEDDNCYAGSIELWRALQQDKDVILALEMNGETLTPDYGYPVRVVIPGIIGARWVKWLDCIMVRKTESPNYYQAHDYKVLPPEVLTWEMAEDYWDKAPSMQENLVNSVVAVPDDDETIFQGSDGLIEVRGYAVPQGDQGPVIRVEVSGDEGNTWVEAELHGAGPQNRYKWCWVLWKARIKVDQGSNKTIYSRATDAGDNTQPMWSEWNIRGVGYNGYGASWNVTVL
ncbi:sulfite oxidase [Coccidioides immitis RS]|uniref:Sulfite oxidase n=1 Tax=Coccidioides immitis (strain RS) TaxID=246410 RepID=A0A0E1RVZ3_COCIM|nr:sulfite oxidase [Coccidioides immitis RS]EAS30948.1 sulfite oxidase [Coccidioides immitis RS]